MKVGDSDSAHRTQFPVMLAPLDGGSPGGPGVDHRDAPLSETFMEPGAGSFHSREV